MIQIYVGVTCTSSRRKKDHWKDQLQEIKELGIREISLFPTTLTPKQRPALYRCLEDSGVKKVKLVHLRGQDFTEREIQYFFDRYNTRFFNCHENDFDRLYQKFPKFRDYILLEPNYDNVIENKIDPRQMGGFCVDLAHFQAAKDGHDVEYDYIMQHLKKGRFRANHLNGYSHSGKRDLHFVTNVKQFDYLKNLPRQIFGGVIGLELENSIKKQLEFKEYVEKILKI